MVYWQSPPYHDTDIAGLSASEAVSTFLVAFETAVISYERLLESGIARNDYDMAIDQNYARLLKSGQCIMWIGGHRATFHAARLIVRQVPEGSMEHFERLWNGLLSEESGLEDHRKDATG